MPREAKQNDNASPTIVFPLPCSTQTNKRIMVYLNTRQEAIHALNPYRRSPEGKDTFRKNLVLIKQNRNATLLSQTIIGQCKPQDAPVPMFTTPYSRTVFANPISSGWASWSNWVRVVWPMLAILLACTACRLPLATGEARLAYGLPPHLVAKPLKLLLPFDFGGGRYRWSPTGYVPLGLLNLALPAPLIFVLFLGALVVISYMLSWLALRSRVFSGTLAICMVFGSQFNYSYVHDGGHHWILFTAYLLINLYFLHALATQPAVSRAPKIGFAISLVVFALSWEQWLDYVVFLMTACGLFYLLCRRDPLLRGRFLGQIKFVAATTILVVLGYLTVRLRYSAEHFTPGHESDSIFTYSSVIMAVDDIISSVFTYGYVALTNFCPSWFNASNSLYHVGAEKIMVEQNGYHAEKGELVYMHHLFFWQFYAGAVMLAFGWLSVRLLRKVWISPTNQSVLFLVFILLICTGFSTHAVIKFRPYLSVPLLAYKCIISVTGVALLLSYGLAVMSGWFSARRTKLIAVCAVWLVLILCGFERYNYHSQMSQQVGLGGFPDPGHAFKKTIRQLFKS
jgi:hypothetical protein